MFGHSLRITYLGESALKSESSEFESSGEESLELISEFICLMYISTSSTFTSELNETLRFFSEPCFSFYGAK